MISEALGALPGFSDSGSAVSGTAPVHQGGMTIGSTTPAWLTWAAVAAVAVVGLALLRRRKG